MFHREYIKDLVFKVRYLFEKTLLKAKPIIASFLKNFPVLFSIVETFGWSVVNLGFFNLSALIIPSDCNLEKKIEL